MKIGLLTLPLYTNYGGILQAYALQQSLKHMGHEVFHIETKKTKSFVHMSSISFYKWWYITRLLKEILIRNPKLKHEHREFKKEWVNARNFVKFINKNISIRDVNNFEDIKHDSIHALIVGSDQIWRPTYFKNIEDSFFSFAKNWENIKRIAYAPSFGIDYLEFSEEQRNYCSQLLKKFNAISVRENEGVLLCKKYFDISCQTVLDPTMLLEKSDYEKLIGIAYSSKTSQLATYILDMNNDKKSATNRLSILKNVKPKELGQSVNNENDNQKKSVENWLSHIINCDFLLTDSFHGCVFAIIFHKPFVVYGNVNRGLSRFNTLLKTFKLENRLVHSLDDVEMQYNTPIQWEIVDEILQIEREKSLMFLKNNL